LNGGREKRGHVVGGDTYTGKSMGSAGRFSKTGERLRKGVRKEGFKKKPTQRGVAPKKGKQGGLQKKTDVGRKKKWWGNQKKGGPEPNSWPGRRRKRSVANGTWSADHQGRGRTVNGWGNRGVGGNSERTGFG